jgi:hypothetical protein
MDLRVDCRAGSAGMPEPQTVWFGERPVQVLAIVDRWYGPQRRWWKVDTAEGQYVLRRDEADGKWELAAVVASDPGQAQP